MDKALKFTKSHEWVSFSDETTARIGITDYAQKEMGDIVFINLPEVGDAIGLGEVFGDLESVKAVSDVYLPVGGVITAVNEELLDSPELINEEAYDAWFVEVGEISEMENFLTAEEYDAFIQAGGE